jgi:sRNA-binding carbon storage regulator CsrA
VLVSYLVIVDSNIVISVLNIQDDYDRLGLTNQAG